jgi:hypothetical protein
VFIHESRQMILAAFFDQPDETHRRYRVNLRDPPSLGFWLWC